MDTSVGLQSLGNESCKSPATRRARQTSWRLTHGLVLEMNKSVSRVKLYTGNYGPGASPEVSARNYPTNQDRH